MDALPELAGRLVSLDISDPWDFVSKQGAGPFEARISAISDDQILLALASRLQYRECEFEHLVATARHVEAGLVAAADGSAVPVNLVPVFTGEDEAGWVTSAGAWRGWHLIGTFRLA